MQIVITNITVTTDNMFKFAFQSFIELYLQIFHLPT